MSDGNSVRFMTSRDAHVGLLHRLMALMSCKLLIPSSLGRGGVSGTSFGTGCWGLEALRLPAKTASRVSGTEQRPAHAVFAIRKPLQRCGQRDNVEFASRQNHGPGVVSLLRLSIQAGSRGSAEPGKKLAEVPSFT